MLGRLKLGAGLGIIGDGAFAGCRAFYACNELRRISVPDSTYFHKESVVYSLYNNVGLKVNFVVKATDTRLMKFHSGAKFRLVISGNKGLKWKSSNPKVARISANGLVVTVSSGTTTLKTVLNDGTSYSCKLKVVKSAI